MLTRQPLLRFGSQGDHAQLLVVRERREDAVVHAEVGMVHVRALEGALHPQGDAAEVIRGHSGTIACSSGESPFPPPPQLSTADEESLRRVPLYEAARRPRRAQQSVAIPAEARARQASGS